MESSFSTQHAAVGGSPVRLTGLCKTYGTFTAVHPLDIDVQAGEFLSFLGPSGSGKTTTLMMLAGFETPSGGQIFVGDREVTHVPPARRNIGMVFQNYALFPHMTVEQNVGFPLRMRGISGRARARTVAGMLEIVGLSSFAGRYPAQLSGGQQQRVALARAIVFRPPVLLMDEPLSALDKYLRSHLQIEIKRIQRELGVTVVYVTHDQEEAMTMSDRICVMRDGRIAQIGQPEALYREPQDEFVAGFLGESNLVKRPVLAAADDTVTIDMGGGAVTLPTRSRVPGKEVKVLVRPEHLRFHPDDQGPAMVHDVTYVGDHRRYDITLPDGTALLSKVQISDGSSAISRGTRLSLDWPVGQMRVFADGQALS
ncbi:ABC transporter ATP-binding protein [Halodurantibacterium flavum]|uniref:Spermidine/putrescine import ATP-binding protein PotA n=1 Tax=Halodurantibacterium flavum TaxID=1382802 RepID=A0ABW4S0N5_9RHOB